MSNVRAMDPTATFPWVPKVDRELPAEEQLTIYYHYLEMTEAAKIDDDQIKSMSKGKKSQYSYLVSQADIKRLKSTITDFTNLCYPDNHPDTDKAGKVVKFSIENIQCIPPEIRTEFVTFITGRDRVAETDEEDGDLGEAQA